MLQGSQCFTCTVGMKISKAQYYVEDTDAVVNMMQVGVQNFRPPLDC